MNSLNYFRCDDEIGSSYRRREQEENKPETDEQEQKGEQLIESQRIAFEQRAPLCGGAMRRDPDGRDRKSSSEKFW